MQSQPYAERVLHQFTGGVRLREQAQLTLDWNITETC
jgi:hypothetical protein